MLPFHLVDQEVQLGHLYCYHEFLEDQWEYMMMIPRYIFRK